MDTPEEPKVTAEPTTPVIPAVPEVIPQPAPAVLEDIVTKDTQPVIEAVPEILVEELQQKNERLKQQLHGREQELEDIRSIKIAEAFQAKPVIEEKQVDEYGEPTNIKVRQPQVAQDNTINQLTIRNAIRGNKSDLIEEFANDRHVPCTAELAKKVEAKILGYDKSGKLLLNPQAWREAYSLVRADLISSKLDEKEASVTTIKEAARKEVIAKEDAKISAAVETSTKPAEVTAEPSMKEITKLLREKKITTAEAKALYHKLVG